MKKYIIPVLACVLATSCYKALDTTPEGPLSNEQLQEMARKYPEKVIGPMVNAMVANIQKLSRDNSAESSNFMVYGISLDMKGNDMVLYDVTSGWFRRDYEMREYREEIYLRSADHWAWAYKLVFQANQILDLIPSDYNENATDAISKTLHNYKANALAMRAFAYYYLMSIYQDDYLHGGKDKPGVPLYKKVEGAKGRTPSQEVWTQVIEDAKKAAELFERSALVHDKSKTDMDATVANVVLARAALTIGDWDQAISAASYVISKYPTLLNEDQYTKSGMMNLDLPETIWGYNWDVTTGYGNRSYPGHMSATCDGGYGGSQGGWKAIDQRLYDQISATDYRKKCYLDAPMDFTYEKVGTRVTFLKYTNMKFSAPKISSSIENLHQDEIFMRVSEMYFVKAEAQARKAMAGSGSYSDAQATLYSHVKSRDSAYVQSTKVGADLVKEILLQKRIELWGEGFEFFDNKRHAISVDRRDSENHWFKEFPGVPNGVMSPAAYTFQIPLAIEINSNPYINAADQNP